MANEPQAAAPQHSGWTEIIKVVGNVFNFFTLIVLVIEAALFFLTMQLEGPERTLSLSAMFLILVLLVALITLMVFLRPEALGIVRPPSPQFPRLLGARFFNALHPYFANLPVSDVKEALSYVEQVLTLDTETYSREERTFVEQFTKSVIGEGRLRFSAPTKASAS